MSSPSTTAVTVASSAASAGGTATRKRARPALERDLGGVRAKRYRRLTRLATALSGRLGLLPLAAFHHFMWACGAGEVYYRVLATPSLFARQQRGYAASRFGQRRAAAARLAQDAAAAAVTTPMVTAAAAATVTTPMVTAAAAAAAVRRDEAVATFAAGVDTWATDLGLEAVFRVPWQEADIAVTKSTSACRMRALRTRANGAFRHRIASDPSLEVYAQLLKAALERARVYHLITSPDDANEVKAIAARLAAARDTATAAATRFRPGQLVVVASGSVEGERVVALALLMADVGEDGTFGLPTLAVPATTDVRRDAFASALQPQPPLPSQPGKDGRPDGLPGPSLRAGRLRRYGPERPQPRLPLPSQPQLPLPEVPLLRHAQRLHAADPRSGGTRRYGPALARMRVHVLYILPPGMATPWHSYSDPRNSCVPLAHYPLHLEYAQTEFVDDGTSKGSHGDWILTGAATLLGQCALTDDLWLNTTTYNARAWVLSVNARRETRGETPTDCTRAVPEAQEFAQFLSARAVPAATASVTVSTVGTADDASEAEEQDGRRSCATTVRVQEHRNLRQSRADYARVMAFPEARLWYPAEQGVPRLGTQWLDEATWLEHERLIVDTLGARCGMPRVLGDLVRFYAGARYLNLDPSRGFIGDMLMKQLVSCRDARHMLV